VVASSSKAFVSLYQTKQRRVLQDSKLCTSIWLLSLQICLAVIGRQKLYSIDDACAGNISQIYYGSCCSINITLTEIMASLSFIRV
jgi:hypothetical protein